MLCSIRVYVKKTTFKKETFETKKDEQCLNKSFCLTFFLFVNNIVVSQNDNQFDCLTKGELFTEFSKNGFVFLEPSVSVFFRCFPSPQRALDSQAQG